MKRRIIVICSLALIVSIVLSMWQIVPSGLGGIRAVVPYLWFSQSRGLFTSPSSTSRVEMVTNDAGAAHSGNFATWVIVRHWWGKEVVAKGYLGSSEGDVPISWSGEKSFTITFLKSWRSEEEEVVRVDLP